MANSPPAPWRCWGKESDRSWRFGRAASVWCGFLSVCSALARGTWAHLNLVSAMLFAGCSGHSTLHMESTKERTCPHTDLESCSSTYSVTGASSASLGVSIPICRRETTAPTMQSGCKKQTDSACRQSVPPGTQDAAINTCYPHEQGSPGRKGPGPCRTQRPEHTCDDSKLFEPVCQRTLPRFPRRELSSRWLSYFRGLRWAHRARPGQSEEWHQLTSPSFGCTRQINKYAGSALLGATGLVRPHVGTCY